MIADAIEISHVSKKFKAKKGTIIEAVTDLSLAVPPGEIFGFLGPNGAGKSTTIKILTGLTKPTSGKARIMGTDVSQPLSRLHLGYLPENPSFYDYLTAEEYLVFVGKTFKLANPDLSSRIERLLKLVDLWDSRKRPIRGYSKGMIQRLGLAQAMIHDPDLYILDEPMSGLDPVGRALVKQIMLDLKEKGKSVFFSTHITADVETVCDRIGVIVHGELQRVERVNTILNEGVVGYHLKVRVPGSAEQKEVDVSKTELPQYVGQIYALGQEIILIEPKRNNIEAFFLSIVKGNLC